jgi:tetratricopeptide (TPR) repeat protein
VTQAEPIFRRVFGDDHPMVAESLALEAAIDARQGHCERAVPTFARATALVEKSKGADALELVSYLTGEADCQVTLGRARDAIAPAERAEAIAHGESIPPDARAQALFALARVRLATGAARADALALARQALELYRAIAPACPVERAELERWLKLHRR